jgi:hypothetical protein
MKNGVASATAPAMTSGAGVTGANVRDRATAFVPLGDARYGIREGLRLEVDILEMCGRDPRCPVHSRAG